MLLSITEIKSNKEMNPKESGHNGGLATRDNHPTVCPACGRLMKSQFYTEIGRRGGEAKFKKYGRQKQVEDGRQGGRGNKKDRGN